MILDKYNMSILVLQVRRYVYSIKGKTKKILYNSRNHSPCQDHSAAVFIQNVTKSTNCTVKKVSD